ncbi:MAG: hypothetical protein LBS08_05260 [Candidatus Symbiothrix sp.]|jgi:hypothetical protein|nr:hypothetical protein [Candidatus Symbiothrix sp.]
MGKGTLEEASINLNEYAGAYPENRMYGQVYPSSGFFFRHVKNISLKNVELTVHNKDFRLAIIFDDVFQATINNLKSD